MTPVFLILGTSMVVAIAINSPYPGESAPNGQWFSLFAQEVEGTQADARLELLSSSQIQARRQHVQAPFIQASHFTRQIRHQNHAFDSRIAFVTPDFFSQMGIDAPIQQLRASQALVQIDFARQHQVDVKDVIEIGEARFQVVGLLSNFNGLDGRTEIYLAEERLTETVYSRMPESLRQIVTSELPLFFYAERTDSDSAHSLIYEGYSLFPVEGIRYAPEEAASLNSINQYILIAALFLSILFVLTDYALSRQWLIQRRGELALRAILGATNSDLMYGFFKIWLIPRIAMLILIWVLLPVTAAYVFDSLDVSNLSVSVSMLLKAAALLGALYGMVLILSVRTILRHLTELSRSVRSIRSSTRRNSSSHVFWAGAALTLMVIVSTALLTSSYNFKKALAQPDHMNSEALHAVTFTLAPGYQVDGNTLGRRIQTVQSALQHLNDQLAEATATTVLPMKEPIYRAEVTGAGGRSLRQPVPVALANVGHSYQQIAQHTLVNGEWPRSTSEIAVNETLLRVLNLDIESMPQIWFEGSRYQVTAVVKDSYWIDPMSPPNPLIWRPTSSSSSNLLVRWFGSRTELEDQLSVVTENLNNGIVVDEVLSVESLRKSRLRELYILFNVLVVVSVAIMAIAIGSLWVAVNSWLAAKKWPLTVHLALGATTKDLNKHLLTQVIWPLMAFAPASAAVSLYVATIIDDTVAVIDALQIVCLALLLVVAAVSIVVWRAYKDLSGLDAVSLTKDVT